MIFPNVRVEIPNIGGYIQQRNDVRYGSVQKSVG